MINIAETESATHDALHRLFDALVRQHAEAIALTLALLTIVAIAIIF